MPPGESSSESSESPLNPRFHWVLNGIILSSEPVHSRRNRSPFEVVAVAISNNLPFDRNYLAAYNPQQVFHRSTEANWTSFQSSTSNSLEAEHRVTCGTGAIVISVGTDRLWSIGSFVSESVRSEPLAFGLERPSIQPIYHHNRTIRMHFPGGIDELMNSFVINRRDH